MVTKESIDRGIHDDDEEMRTVSIDDHYIPLVRHTRTTRGLRGRYGLSRSFSMRPVAVTNSLKAKGALLTNTLAFLENHS